MDKKLNIDRTPSDYEAEELMLNRELNSLAFQGNPLASFSYAKELYSALRNGQFQNYSQEA